MGNHPLAAVVSALALRRRWWAVRGHRAFCDGARLRVSQASVLAASFICHSNLFWPRPPEDLFNGMTHDPASGTVERRLRSLYGPEGRGWRRDRCGGHAGRQALGSRANLVNSRRGRWPSNRFRRRRATNRGAARCEQPCAARRDPRHAARFGRRTARVQLAHVTIRRRMLWPGQRAAGRAYVRQRRWWLRSAAA
jgi:hypothetical protein